MCSVPDGRGGIRFHVDTLDLYAARARAASLVAAAAELAVTDDVVKRDLGRVLLTSEDLAEALSRPLSPPWYSLASQPRWRSSSSSASSGDRPLILIAVSVSPGQLAKELGGRPTGHGSHRPHVLERR